MKSRLPLGIHHSDYHDDVREHHDYRVLTQANVQCLHERFQDIACLDQSLSTSKEQVWVQCYPGKEAAGSSSDQIKASPSYRKWGSFQSGLALILPLAIKSGHSPGCVIRNFQIQVVLKDLEWLQRQEPIIEGLQSNQLKPSNREFHIPLPFFGPRFADTFTTNGCIHVLRMRRIAGVQHGPEIPAVTKMRLHQDVRPSVSLLDMPHPQLLEKCYVPEGWFVSGKWWKFESRSLPGPFPGHLHGAHMRWSGSRHEPHLLHCGLAIEHSEEPFGLTCRVSGQAYMGLYTYAFDNVSGNEERIWQIQPQPPTQDLEGCIADLANQMHELNRTEMARAVVSELDEHRVPSPPHSQYAVHDRPAIRGHIYPSITVNGSAQLGDYMPTQY